MTSDDPSTRAFYDVAYLVSCAVREIAPEADRVRAMDLDLVFREAQRQLLAGCCAFALEAVGMCTDAFMQAKASAVRKVVLFDTQRAQVLDALEGAGIWYMPLKGAVLKDCYPSVGMREMSDNDILFDATRASDVRAIMEGLGFDCERTEVGAHDNYHKKPVYNFEMHRVLFTGECGPALEGYYRDVRDRLVPDEGRGFGYHFSPEDFYLFMVAHEYKHYSISGTGLRGCVDTYVYLGARGLDMDYVRGEAEKMGIAEFERRNRDLSRHLMEGAELAGDELEMLDYMRRGGVYGNVDLRVERRVGEFGGGALGKARYVLSRAFIPMDSIRSAYPFFYRHKILLPLVPVIRFGKMLTTSRKRVASELRALRKN